MKLKDAAIALAIILFLLTGLTAILPLFSLQLYKTPIFWGWRLATVNFVLALVSSMWAMNRSLLACLGVVVAGTAVRMMIMLAAVVWVMRLNKTWFYPFSLSLLCCFIVYITAEIILIIIKSRQWKK